LGADTVEATNKGIRVVNDKVDLELVLLYTKTMEPVSDGNFFNLKEEEEQAELSRGVGVTLP